MPDFGDAITLFKGLNLVAIFFTLVITQQIKPLFPPHLRRQVPFILGLLLGAIVEHWSPYQFDPFILAMRMWTYGGASTCLFWMRKPLFTRMGIYRPDADDPTNGGIVPPPAGGTK